MGFIFIKEIPKLIENGLFSINPDGVSIDGLNITINDQANPDSLAQAIIENDSLVDNLEFLNSDSTLSQTIDSISNIGKTLFSIENDSSEHPFLKDIIADKITENNPEYFNVSFNIFYDGMLIILLFGFLFSLPFKRYFRLKRKERPVSTRLEFFCRRYLLYTPIIYTLMYGLVILSTIGYIAICKLIRGFIRKSQRKYL